MFIKVFVLCVGMDFLKQMETMTVEELLDVYKQAQKLIPLKVKTPEEFSLVLEKILGSE